MADPWRTEDNTSLHPIAGFRVPTALRLRAAGEVLGHLVIALLFFIYITGRGQPAGLLAGLVWSFIHENKKGDEK